MVILNISVLFLSFINGSHIANYWIFLQMLFTLFIFTFDFSLIIFIYFFIFINLFVLMVNYLNFLELRT